MVESAWGRNGVGPKQLPEGCEELEATSVGVCVTHVISTAHMKPHVCCITA